MPESVMRAPIAENAMEAAQMDEFEGNGLFLASCFMQGPCRINILLIIMGVNSIGVFEV